MLVLTRKKSESIVILFPNGDRINIILSDAEHEKASLAFDAPKHIKIYRQEVWDRVQEELELEKKIEQEKATKKPIVRRPHIAPMPKVG